MELREFTNLVHQMQRARAPAENRARCGHAPASHSPREPRAPTGPADAEQTPDSRPGLRRSPDTRRAVVCERSPQTKDEARRGRQPTRDGDAHTLSKKRK